MRSMFINIGTKDGFDKGKMLSYLCGITGLTGEFRAYPAEGHVQLYRHHDEHFDEAMGHFRDANYKGARSAWMKEAEPLPVRATSRRTRRNSARYAGVA